MQRMWQRDDKTVAVRWSVQCSPRLIGGVTGSKVRLDGISEYRFNDKGKVSKHTVDVINWNGLHNALGLKPSLLAARFLLHHPAATAILLVLRTCELVGAV